MTRRGASDLHAEARSLLNRLCDAGDADVVDLTTPWPRWGEWLASLDASVQKFHQGVVAFTAEFIQETSDSNRMGRRRLDFFVTLADGSYWRLHPGTTIKSSAKPRHFPAELPGAQGGTARGAAEHAGQQWAALDEQVVWTWQRAALVPQGDRWGKQEMWLSLQQSAQEGRVPWYPQEVDVTDGAVTKWWLWTCNLGKNTAQVIGAGIERAFLTRGSLVEYHFRFVRVDGSEACVVLGQEARGGNTQVYFRVL